MSDISLKWESFSLWVSYLQFFVWILDRIESDETFGIVEATGVPTTVVEADGQLDYFPMELNCAKITITPIQAEF